MFHDPIIWIVWCWCLLRASHKEHKFPFNGKDVELKDGEFISGRSAGSSECHISEQQWRTAMGYLKSTSRITSRSTNRFTVFTVQKWKEYQSDNQQTNQPLTSKQPATNQPLTTYKKGKNVKNDKNTTEKIFSTEKTTTIDHNHSFNERTNNVKYNALKKVRAELVKKMILSQ